MDETGGKGNRSAPAVELRVKTGDKSAVRQKGMLAVTAFFEELDYAVTPIGALSLRRRRDHKLGQAWAEPVRFHNPLQDRDMVQTVYLGRVAADAA